MSTVTTFGKCVITHEKIQEKIKGTATEEIGLIKIKTKKIKNIMIK